MISQLTALILSTVWVPEPGTDISEYPEGTTLIALQENQAYVISGTLQDVVIAGDNKAYISHVSAEQNCGCYFYTLRLDNVILSSVEILFVGHVSTYFSDVSLENVVFDGAGITKAGPYSGPIRTSEVTAETVVFRNFKIFQNALSTDFDSSSGVVVEDSYVRRMTDSNKDYCSWNLSGCYITGTVGNAFLPNSNMECYPQMDCTTYSRGSSLGRGSSIGNCGVGDFDGDGHVTFNDLTAVLSGYSSDFEEVLLVLSTWGQSFGPLYN